MSLKVNNKNNLIPFFGGFCFFLSAIELIIPKPIPFSRLGLANLPILLAADVFSFPAFLSLLLIKVLGQALISGTLFSFVFLFSIVGTFTSGIIMYCLKKLPKNSISFVGVSICGAFVSNIAQISLARFLIFGKGIMYAIPPMLIIGLITAIFLGVFAESFAQDSLWYKSVLNGRLCVSVNSKNDIKGITAYLKISAGFLLLLLLLSVNLLEAQTVILGAALILCIVSKIKINFIQSAVVIIGIILFNLYPAHGKIIFSIGNFRITSEALLYGIQKAVILEGMIYISKWVLSSKIKLYGKIGEAVSQSFEVFSKLLSVKKHINPKKLIPTLDAIMLSFEKL